MKYISVINDETGDPILINLSAVHVFASLPTDSSNCLVTFGDGKWRRIRCSVQDIVMFSGIEVAPVPPQ